MFLSHDHRTECIEVRMAKLIACTSLSNIETKDANEQTEGSKKLSPY